MSNKICCHHEDRDAYDGHTLHSFAQSIWSYDRSITGTGVRKTLRKIQEVVPNLKIFDIKSGEKAFDWTIPQEWVVREAWIKTPSGEKICEFNVCNLHLVGYSTATHCFLPLDALQNHLFSVPEQPSAVPYVTSYYEKRWGFCISDRQRQNLLPGEYEVYIDAEHFEGVLNYGEVFIPGESSDEILLSTYVCHPSMANNEISGITVATFISKFLNEIKNLRYSYRIVFVPETIGAIAFINRNLNILKQRVVAGYNITCVGDDRNYSYIPSRRGNSISDKVASHVLQNITAKPKIYSWLDRGSDERQYCAPGVDLPIGTLLRTKFGEYPEYHTSLDDLFNVVTPAGLKGGYNYVQSCITVLENNSLPTATSLCEPQLGRRGLYPTLSTTGSAESTKLMMDILSYSDGQSSLLDIANMLDTEFSEVLHVANLLVDQSLLKLRRV